MGGRQARQCYHRNLESEWPLGSYKVDSALDMALRGLKDKQHLNIQPKRVTKPPWVYRLEENEVIQVSAKTSQGDRLVQQIPQQGWIGSQQLPQCNKRMFHAIENHGEMGLGVNFPRPRHDGQVGLLLAWVSQQKFGSERL